MNKIKVLELIKEFKETKDFSKLEKLENIVIESIKLDKVAETTSKTRYNAANKVLKRLKGSRPTLEKTVIRDGYQYFTDSYVAFKLKNAIPELPIIENESIYPNLDSIIDSIKENTAISFECEWLKKEIKISKDKITLTIPNSDDKIIFNKNYLLEVLQILDFKNKDIVVMEFNNSKIKNNNLVAPVKIRNNEDLAIIIPCRA